MTLSAEDRLDILDLIGRADQLATRRDAGAYADLFTADAMLDGSQGVHPATPITIRTAAAITQKVRRTGGTWRITRRTVAPAPAGDGGAGGAGGEAGPRGPG